VERACRLLQTAEQRCIISHALSVRTVGATDLAALTRLQSTSHAASDALYHRAKR
jgi:hypothetical protein